MFHQMTDQRICRARSWRPCADGLRVLFGSLLPTYLPTCLRASLHTRFTYLTMRSHSCINAHFERN